MGRSDDLGHPLGVGADRHRGREDCFADQALQPLAKNRIIADPQEVVRRAPDIILGSWCGKKFRPELVAARSGWEQMPAVANGALHEIKSSIILQPGPAALTDGVETIHSILAAWQESSRR
jgi:iron complex transport system substrate-binding protein